MKSLKLDVPADDVFDDVEAGQQVHNHLRRVNDALLLGAGALVMLYVLSLPRPSLLFGSIATFPLALVLLIFVPGIYGLYLAFMPHWREVPLVLHRSTIARSLSLSLLAVALIPVLSFFEGHTNLVFLVLLLLGGVATLHVWQQRPRGNGADEDELFP